MQVIRSSLLSGAKATRGMAVVVDVFRAFSCTPLLFSLGIKRSILVATAQEAINLKDRDQRLILIGEVGGVPIEGFDLGNSPSQILLRGAEFLMKKPLCNGPLPAYKGPWPHWRRQTGSCWGAI